MRMSCNGCRVLRKGCSEDCSIRPCLQWIKNPESQANATVFLAKFYGRAGLLNLINTGPDHLRPAIFRSLLYEACGRIVNPVYGSVGLLWSGNWPLCQAAVDAVLKGAAITQMTPDAAESASMSPIKSFDIRHVAKDFGSNGHQQHSKRPCPAPQEDATDHKRQRAENESSASHQSERTSSGGPASSSHESEDTADGSMVTSHDGSDVELDLSLGLAGGAPTPATRAPTKRCDVSSMSEGDDTCTVNLTLDLAS